MSIQKILKGEHQCGNCGRVSSSPSVLKQKKEKDGSIFYYCSNAKKCKLNAKNGLPKNYQSHLASRRVKKEKKVVAKKAKEPKETKKTEKVEAPATA